MLHPLLPTSEKNVGCRSTRLQHIRNQDREKDFFAAIQNKKQRDNVKLLSLFEYDVKKVKGIFHC